MERADKKALGGGSKQARGAGWQLCLCLWREQSALSLSLPAAVLIGSGQDAVPMACPLLAKKQ